MVKSAGEACASDKLSNDRTFLLEENNRTTLPPGQRPIRAGGRGGASSGAEPELSNNRTLLLELPNYRTLFLW